MPQLPAARAAYQRLAVGQIAAQQRPVAYQWLAAARAAQSPAVYRQLRAELPSWAQGPERAQLPGPA